MLLGWIKEPWLLDMHAHRTNEEGIKQLKQMLEPKGVDVIVADLPHYKGNQDVFHLSLIHI